MNKVKAILDVNGDGVTNMDDIYFIMADIMKEQKKLNIPGSDKKANVLKTLKNIIGLHLYDRFEPLLSPAIEFILSVANSKVILKHLKTNCKCL